MMKSGTYKYINGKVQLVNDHIPNLNGTFDFHCSEPYFSVALGQPIYSKRHKQYLMESRNLIERGPNDKIIRPKPSPERRLREIKERINQHLTDKGVEGIKLKDLHKQRGEVPWEKRTSEEQVAPILQAQGLKEIR
jgi:hypothetical protein